MNEAIDNLFARGDTVIVHLPALLEMVETEFFNYIPDSEREEEDTERAMASAKRVVEEVKRAACGVRIDDFLVIKPGTTIFTVKPDDG